MVATVAFKLESAFFLPSLFRVWVSGSAVCVIQIKGCFFLIKNESHPP
jgi:hypothetical protein